MQYLITQWIIWLIIAALIGGIVGFLLNRGPRVAPITHDAVSDIEDATAGQTEAALPEPEPVSTEPPAMDPPGAEPLTPHPPTAESPTVEPSTMDPPAGEPLTLQPPPQQARPILGIPRPQHDEVVAERDELKRLLDDRDALIDRLYDAVDQRDERLTDLSGTSDLVSSSSAPDVEEMRLALAEREAALDALYSAIDERDDAIEALYDAVAQRDRRIAELREAVAPDNKSK